MGGRCAALSWGVLLAVCCCGAELRGQEGSGPSALKVGVELDSNPSQQVAPAGGWGAAGALRAFIKLQEQRRVGEGGGVEGKLLLGAKHYWDLGEEDALLVSWTQGLRWALWRWPNVGLLEVSGRVDLGDRSERRSRRDYFRVGVVAGLRWVAEGWWLWGGGGYRFFHFKPDAASDHDGGVAEFGLGVRLWEEASALVNYTLLDRRFAVPRMQAEGELVVLDHGVLRRDRLHAWRAAVSYHSGWSATLAYTLQLNRTNGFGSGLVRHTGELRLGVPLPWDLLMAGSLRVQRTWYDDPVRIDETLQIDDENRNELVLSLQIPLWTSVALELRYGLYTEGMGDEAHFLRHLIYGGLGVDFALFD